MKTTATRRKRLYPIQMSVGRCIFFAGPAEVSASIPSLAGLSDEGGERAHEGQKVDEVKHSVIADLADMVQTRLSDYLCCFV